LLRPFEGLVVAQSGLLVGVATAIGSFLWLDREP
jgi:hypothetical protein